MERTVKKQLVERGGDQSGVEMEMSSWSPDIWVPEDKSLGWAGEGAYGTAY